MGDTTDRATTSAMPTTVTTAIPMPTMDITTARGPLMPRLPLRLLPLPLLRLTLMLSMPPMPTDMAWPTTATAMVMPIMDTVLDTTAMPTPTDTDMPTVPMDTTATPTVTDSDTTD